MARLALSAVGTGIELPGVGIGVADDALLVFRHMEAQFAAHIPRLGIVPMTLLAFDGRVLAFERELRLRMIEELTLDLLKAIGGVALRTCLREFSLVRIGMARLAHGEFHFHVLDRLAVGKLVLMTLRALNFFMLAEELKLGLRVIELRCRLPLIV
jgi:hypothetical protein